MTNPDVIEVTVQLELADFQRLRTKAFRVVAFWLTALAVTLIILVTWTIVQKWDASKPREENVVQIVVRLAPVLAIFPILLAVFFLRGRFTFAARRSLHRPITYRFSADGMDAVTTGAFAHVDWANFHKVQETKADFLLYQTSHLVYPVPKRCFEDEDQVWRFRELLREHLGERAQLL